MTPTPTRPIGFAGWLAAFWGVGGVIALLVYAAGRLAGQTQLALELEWSMLQWVVFIANTLFMAYSEGYRGFQKSFSPRTVARAMWLARNPDWISGLLAPLFCAGYFMADKRVRMVVWIGTFLIVILVLLLRLTPQPWRGIIDAGVVVGLSWGTVSLLFMFVRAVLSGEALADHRVGGTENPADPG